MIKRALAKLITRPIWWTLHNYRVLSVEFGQFRTIRRRECIDKDGRPTPWYTYPAIEYIKQLDLSDMTMFEYGSGNSTLFWADRCRKVVAIEDNEVWYERMRSILPKNVEYHFLKDKLDYTTAINRHESLFDIIAVDGSHRYECTRVARQRLQEDGLMILDNSDWWRKSSALLRASDLIEVDMSGFGPINPYTWTTSFYFSRKVNLKPAHLAQPIHGIGSVLQVAQEPDD